MKVAIVCDVLNEHSGSRVAIRLGQELSKKTDDTVVYFASNKLLSQETYANLAKRNQIFVFSKPRFLSLSLVKRLRQEKVDVISAHCSLRILISAYLSGIPVIRTDYGTQFPSVNGDYGSWKIGFWNKVTNLLADAFVYLRDALKFYFSKETIGISHGNSKEVYRLYGRKIDYIYLGSDNFGGHGQESGYSQEGLGQDGKVRILSVSRFVPYKGFHILVDVATVLRDSFPEVELVLAGSQNQGPYFEFLKKRTDFLGWVKIIVDPSDVELRRLFLMSNIYASATRWEGWGLTFLEASSFGLPTLGFSSFVSASEVIHNGRTGYLAGTVEDFGQKLNILMRNRELRLELGLYGKEFSQRFTWEQMAKEYCDLFKRIIP